MKKTIRHLNVTIPISLAERIHDLKERDKLTVGKEVEMALEFWCNIRSAFTKHKYELKEETKRLIRSVDVIDFKSKMVLK